MSLSEMTCLRLFVIVFEAICFICIKLFVEQPFSNEFACDTKVCRTFNEF